MSRQEKEQTRVHIRWMIRRDMPEVLQTEQESFEYAWTEEDFIRALQDCIGMVAEQGERVVGFMCYELYKGRLHILNFAVHPHYRRHGVGSQMVAKLTGKLAEHRRSRITALIGKGNEAAGQFFGLCGFQAAKELLAYWPDTGRDAMILQYCIPGTEEAAAELALLDVFSDLITR